MSNSFYYFFSASAQVLAAILALFGVFVIFKIQTLTTELLEIGRKLKHLVTNVSVSNKLEEGQQLQVLIFLMSAEFNKEVFNLKNLIKTMKLDQTNLLCKVYIGYHQNKIKFDDLYLTYKTIINKTIQTSILTALLIVFCLGILPFGKFIDNNTTVMLI